MKKLYLENTNAHHNKFYKMKENPDGASFTASWGRIGTTGRTQIYGMNEWNLKYGEKINNGYKDTTSGIQGMSVAQRKKLGITTVQPFYQPKKTKKKPKAIKKTTKGIHYDVGQVDVKVNHSHQNKLRILKMTMENWAHDDGKSYALDSQQGRMYEADLHKVEELVERGTFTMGNNTPSVHFLSQEEMLDMNVLFKTYGGKRKK
jgi:predicted DNA-binding WGR domain protein